MKIFIKFWLLSSGLCALKTMKSYMGNLPVNTESSVFWTTACLVPGAYNLWSKSPLASWSLRSAHTTSPSLVILLDLSEDKASCTLKTDIDANQRLGNRPCSANPGKAMWVHSQYPSLCEHSLRLLRKAQLHGESTEVLMTGSQELGLAMVHHSCLSNRENTFPNTR